jgi:uncharacterized membrane protein
MDENKPPEEPILTPEPDPIPAPDPVPAPPSAASQQISAAMSATPKGGPVPFSGPPDLSVPQDERSQALLVWVLSIFFWFIPSLIFYFTAKDKPFVFHHAAQALTFQIVVLVLWIVSFILMFIVIGVFLLPLIGLAALVINIMGAIAANAGSRFEPPVTGGLAKSWFKA